MATKSKLAGWIPDQHGAWAMVSLPVIIGLVLRHRAHQIELFQIAVVPAWFFGYFLFNAAVLAIKSSSARRSRFLKPLIVYGLATLLSGLIVLLLGGWSLIWWACWFIVLIGWAIWEVITHHERALSSGAATIAAACTMILVLRFITPQTIWQNWNESASRSDLLIALAVFSYFFGTLYYVKTMIRERGKPKWLAYSLSYHGLAVIVFALLALYAQSSWGWVIFFALCLARAFLAPWLANSRGVKIKPKTIGLVEIALSLSALVIALVL